MDKINISINQKVLDKIRNNILSFDWTKLPEKNDWTLGASKKFLKEICSYWVKDYSWRNEEIKLNRLNHYKTMVDDLKVHFVHVRGKAKKAIPLLISHGWPGSFLEFKYIIEPLTDPVKFNLDDNLCFDIIMPSIPGFIFSDPPNRPYGPRKIAEYYNKLMIDILGYNSYVAQGGDWGGAISTWLGYDHSNFCKAIHLNIMIMRDRKGPLSEEEKLWQNQFKKEQVMEEGYRSLQATKPQTLAYAMNDNPVGVAAWILEKFHGWSDLKNRNLLDIYSKNDLLTNIMLYLVTNSFSTASWIYYGRREEGGRIMNVDAKVTTPTACALFPAEFLSWPPKTYVERMYNIFQWKKMKSGGHFAALEEPKLLIEDIREFGFKIKNIFM